MSSEAPPATTGSCREILSLWHLWLASVVEDAGELPEGLERETAESLLRFFRKRQDALVTSLEDCTFALKTLEKR